MTDGAWSVATFDGLAKAQRRSIAGWSAQERWEWLNEAVELAALSGALERSLAEKQRTIDSAWGQPD